MKTHSFLASGLVVVGAANFALARSEEAAEVRVGTGVEKMELQGEAKAFKVAAGTKLWAWTKVNDLADAKISVVFEKGGKAVSKQELQVPRKAYRTYAYRTFRKGDGGAWTAKVQGPDGKELGSAAFTVDVE